MTASLLKAPATVGAPYIAGDPIAVEYFGQWREAVVDGITLNDSSRFGLRWTLHVMLRDTEDFLYVRCDDNGRNHTWRNQVCPSSYVSEGGAL